MAGTKRSILWLIVGLTLIAQAGEKPKAKTDEKHGTPSGTTGIFHLGDQDTAYYYTFEQRENARLDALVWALRTRILTPKEMKQVERLGIRLFIRYHGGSGNYFPAELEHRLNELMLLQFKMRLAADEKKKPCRDEVPTNQKFLKSEPARAEANQ